MHAPSVKRMHSWRGQEAGQAMGAGAAKHSVSPSLKEGNMTLQSAGVSCGYLNQKSMKKEMSGKQGGSRADFFPQSSLSYKLLYKSVME